MRFFFSVQRHKPLNHANHTNYTNKLWQFLYINKPCRNEQNKMWLANCAVLVHVTNALDLSVSWWKTIPMSSMDYNVLIDNPICMELTANANWHYYNLTVSKILLLTKSLDNDLHKLYLSITLLNEFDYNFNFNFLYKIIKRYMQNVILY